MNFLDIIFGTEAHVVEKKDYVVAIKKNMMEIEHPNGRVDSILWDGIIEIKMIISEDEHLVDDTWLALLGDDRVCLIPQNAIGYLELFDIVSKFDNFNVENVVEALSCTGNAEYNLWKRDN